MPAAETSTGPTVGKLLTDEAVKKLPAPSSGSRITYDSGNPAKAIKGFGARVTASSAKAFVLNYRIHGRERRLTIGSFPAWTVSAAREEAHRLRREIDQGRDPLVEREAKRAAPTMAELCDRYLIEHAVRKRERSRVEDESLIRQWVLPKLGGRKAADIRHADIDRLHRKITQAGTPIRANRTVTLLSKIFALAIRWEIRADNPASKVERNDEEPRARYLKDGELRRLTAALAARPDQAAANAVRLLLLTGARRGEVLGASWDQFDLDAGIWTKPSAHTKQKREHRVPLSAPARALLANMKAAGDAPYLFPSRGGTAPLTDIKKSWAAICRAADLQGLRLHDLRHSYASVLASAGLSLPVIGALLGHTQPATTARYTHLFDNPLRAATERVGAIVTAAEGSERKDAEVIGLPAGRGRR
jgi:integrase